jgi:hypothetical protein
LRHRRRSVGGEKTANPIRFEITVDLSPKIPGRLLQPMEDLQSTFVVDGAQAVEKL